MNTRDLERELEALLRVTEPELLRLGDRLRRGIRRRRLLVGLQRLGAAAAVVIALLVGLDRGEDGGVSAPRMEETFLLTIAADDEAREEAYEEPSFGQAAADCDWLLRGRVEKVREQEVAFRVAASLRGDLEAARLHLSRAFDEPRISCRRSCTWTEGEELVLALVRDPDDGHVKVHEGRSGQGRFPIQEMITIEDFLTIWEEGAYPADRLAAALRAQGPAFVFALRYHLGALLDAELPIRNERVQDVLEGFVRAEVAGQDELERRRGALRHLERARFASLPESLRDEITNDMAARLAAMTSIHARARLAAQHAGLGLRAARDPLVRTLDEALAALAERPRADGYAALVLRHLPALGALDREAAIRYARRLFEERPAFGQADAGEALALLLEFGEEEAPRLLIEKTRELAAAGEPVWLDLLFTTEAPGVRPLLRELLAAPDFRLAQNRYDHTPWKRIEATGRREILRATAPVIEKRLRDGTMDLAPWTDWYRLHRQHSRSLEPFAGTLRMRLESIDRVDVYALYLVRDLAELLGVEALPYRHPTDAEIAAGARRLAGVLRD